MLEVRNISKRLGGQVVLCNVSLTVAPGEVVGLVGMNGSGKTTLLDVLTGRTHADAGEVWFDGRRAVPRRPFAPKVPIFRSYQVPRLFYGLSSDDNLELGRWALGGDAQRADILPAPALALPAEVLSTGQRRRVIMDWLRARVAHAKYFLLDEPAAGGDEALVALLLEFIGEARRQQRGVLLVEHRDNVLRAACDRIIYLRDGACSAEPPTNGMAIEPPERSGAAIPPAGDQVLLAARGLVVARGSAVVPGAVDFQARMGDIIAVTGPNGCGKSTLLRAIYGDPSCPVTGGTLTSEGADLTKLGMRERAARGVHLLPQDGAFFPSMTVEDALRASVEAVKPQAWQPEATGRVRREIPGLDRIWCRRCGLLSGGERRLASIARVLLLQPRVALLDEPLAGVDADGRKRILREVERLAEAGAAVVIAEQASQVRSVPYNRLVELGSSDRRHGQGLRCSDGP